MSHSKRHLYDSGAANAHDEYLSSKTTNYNQTYSLKNFPQQQRQHHNRYEKYHQQHNHQQLNDYSNQPAIVTDHNCHHQSANASPHLQQSIHANNNNSNQRLQQPPTATGNQCPPTHCGDCSVKFPLDILWLPKSVVMQPVGPDTLPNDCILVVGVSRPKLTVVFLTVMLISLFLTFHVLYDSAIYNLQMAQAVHQQQQQQQPAQPSFHYYASQSPKQHDSMAYLQPIIDNDIDVPFDENANQLSDVVGRTNQQISHPMVFPSNRVHFPKTSRYLPQALIIGIRKCGTRALLEMLYLHPRIQKAGGEVHFFDRDENYQKGLEWYRKKMPHSFRGQITIEKSPSYFISPEVPERVRAMNASIKLLLIVREPVTRAISDYTQLRSHAATAAMPLASDMPDEQQQSYNFNKLKSVQLPAVGDSTPVTDGSGDDGNENAAFAATGNALAAIDGKFITKSVHGYGQPGTTAANMVTNSPQIASKSFEELAILPNGTVNDSYRPLTISMYHLHLHRWLEIFPREQLLVVNGDRLIDDPVSQLQRIESFLGIEHRITANHFYFNATKGFYCLRYNNGDRCLRETKGRKHPYVHPNVVSKLRKFFAEHNQHFYELIGEDLGWPEE